MIRPYVLFNTSSIIRLLVRPRKKFILNNFVVHVVPVNSYFSSSNPVSILIYFMEEKLQLCFSTVQRMEEMPTNRRTMISGIYPVFSLVHKLDPFQCFRFIRNTGFKSSMRCDSTVSGIHFLPFFRSVNFHCVVPVTPLCILPLPIYPTLFLCILVRTDRILSTEHPVVVTIRDVLQNGTTWIMSLWKIEQTELLQYEKEIQLESFKHRRAHIILLKRFMVLKGVWISCFLFRHSSNAMCLCMRRPFEGQVKSNANPSHSK